MKRLLALMISLLLLLTLFTACAKPLEKLSAAELLDLGEKYLLEMNYEQAIVYFDRLIEVEPRNPRGYTGLAEAYGALEDTERAIEALKHGLASLPGDSDIQALLDKLLPPPEPSSSPIPNLDPTPELIPEPAPYTEGTVVASDYQISSYTYSFAWEDNWNSVDAALGGCYIFLTIGGDTQSIYGVSNILGDNFTDDVLQNYVEDMLLMAKERADGPGGYFNGNCSLGLPIMQQYLGTKKHIALIAFDTDYEYLGKIVLEVQIPMNPT